MIGVGPITSSDLISILIIFLFQLSHQGDGNEKTILQSVKSLRKLTKVKGEAVQHSSRMKYRCSLLFTAMPYYIMLNLTLGSISLLFKCFPF